MATGKHRAREVSRRWRTVSLLLIGVLVGMLLISPAGADFRRNTKHLGMHAWKQVVKGKVFTRKQANNRFSQRLWALVLFNGNLVRGNRVVDAKKTGTGSYEVRFNRNVEDCGYQTTPFFSAFGVAQVSLAVNDTVIVATANMSGTLSDRSFSLLVTC